MRERKKNIIRYISLAASLVSLAAAVYVRFPLISAEEMVSSLLSEGLARTAVPAGSYQTSVEETENTRKAETADPASESANETDLPETPAETDEPAVPDETEKPAETAPPEETGEGLPISERDMSAGQSADHIAINNSSKYNVDPDEYARADYPLPYAAPASGRADEPLVLIVHTHGTESYMQTDKSCYSDPSFARSTDTQANVVAVGRALSEALNGSGVKTVHCETMFDLESYSGSYDASEKAVVEYLKKYPSIRYVFDVHRDYAEVPGGGMVKCATEINGEKCAQAMFVVGTDSQGADHPYWRENLKVAAAFQKKLLGTYPSLMRPINLRGPSFNAEHAPGSVLIEIGMAGNTLDEAKRTAYLLGNVIAKVIKCK